MGDFNAHNTARGNEALTMRLLNLVYAVTMLIVNELSVCNGRWTLECGDKKSVIN